MNPNAPLWDAQKLADRQAFQESWTVKLIEPKSQRALWLRFNLLVSRNGFRRIIETWAQLAVRDAKGEVSNRVLKQTHDISAFGFETPDLLRFGDSELSGDGQAGFTRGQIRSKGDTLKWDLSFEALEGTSFEMSPHHLKKLGLVRNSAVTLSPNLIFSGTAELNGEVMQFEDALGMQTHLSGPEYRHSWTFSHCNTFAVESGEPSTLVFQGLTERKALRIPGPAISYSSFYFLYKGESYLFNSMWDSLGVKSSSTLTGWTFRVDRGDLSFRGQLQAAHKDFAGLTFEDTNGSLVYTAHSRLSDLQLQIYRAGKLEASFLSKGTASFEVASREKNPYVALQV